MNRRRVKWSTNFTRTCLIALVVSLLLFYPEFLNAIHIRRLIPDIQNLNNEETIVVYGMVLITLVGIVKLLTRSR